MSGPILLALRAALALALYAFLGWMLINLWRSLRRQAAMVTTSQAPAITLTNTSAALGELPVPEFLYSIAEVTIGRDPTCDCQLDDKTVSASHARLSYHHGNWWVEDLNSRNGTYLNDSRVSEPLVLTPGDELRCGQVVFIVAIGEAERSDPQALKSPVP